MGTMAPRALDVTPARSAARSPGSTEARAPLSWDIVDHRHDLYGEVIALRKRAYGASGKLGDDCSVMADVFDERARILVAHRDSAPGTRAVASLRIIHHGPSDRWEHEAFIGWSDALPPRAETVEITRFCVDPAFRDRSTITDLFQRTGLDIVMGGKRYFIGSATREMLPIYARLGCRALPLAFRYDGLGTDLHHLFRADCWAGLHGVGIDALSWSFAWARIYARWRSSSAYPGAAIPFPWRARVALLGAMERPLYRLAEATLRRARRPAALSAGA
jgi:hypothetical protein